MHKTDNLKSFIITVLSVLGLFAGTASAEMVGFWNFDHGSTANAISGNTDLVGGGTYTLENGVFTANNGYLSGGSTAAKLPTGTSPYTVSVFLNTKATGNCDIISWGNTTGAGTTGFRLDGNGVNIREYWWNGNDFTANTTVTPANSGTWNHITIGSDGANQLVFFNGQLLGQNTPTTSHATTNENFNIGSRHTPATNLTGSVDNVSIYNTRLLHSDVITVSSSRYNDLVGWWKTGDVSSGANVDRINGISQTTDELRTLTVDTAHQTFLYNATTQANATEFRLFDRVLTSSEKAYYQGQMATGHDYTLQTTNGVLSTVSGKTTWVQNGTAEYDSSVTTAPLGLFVGGNTSTSVVNVNTAKIRATNRILVLAGGTVNLTGDVTGTGAISVDFTKTLDVDGGSFNVVAKNANNLLAYLNLQGGSRFTVTSGSVTTGYVRIGDNGTGVANFVLNGGTVHSPQIHVGDHASGVSGILTVNGGTLTVDNDLVVGQNVATGYLNQNGGTITSGNLRVGNNGSPGTLIQTGGILKAASLIIGHGGTDRTGYGTFLADTLHVGSQAFATENSVNLTNNLVIYQGKVAVETLNIHGSSVNVKDTLQVHNLIGATTSNLQFTVLGTHPNISTLAFTNSSITGDAPTYSGDFALTPATLQIGADENELTILTIDGDYTQSVNTTLELNVNTTNGSYDQLRVTDGSSLNLNGTLDLILDSFGGEFLYSFPLFNGNIRSAFSNILVNGETPSERWNFSGLNVGGNGIVTFNNVPEPASWTLLLLALATVFRRRKIF